MDELSFLLRAFGSHGSAIAALAPNTILTTKRSDCSAIEACSGATNFAASASEVHALYRIREWGDEG